MPATRSSKKDRWGHDSCGGGSPCPCTLGAARVPVSQGLGHLHPQLSLGQSCHRQKSLVPMRPGSLRQCPTLRLCGLWPARLLCQGGEFSRQEYWSVLANAGCHTLLEHYTSYSPSCHYPPPSPGCCQNPWDPSSHTPPHLVLTGADPSPPGQPQEQTPVDDPHAEVEIKSQLKPRGRVTKEEDPKPSHQMYKLQIKFTGSTRQTLCLWNI